MIDNNQIKKLVVNTKTLSGLKEALNQLGIKYKIHNALQETLDEMDYPDPDIDQKQVDQVKTISILVNGEWFVLYHKGKKYGRNTQCFLRDKIQQEVLLVETKIVYSNTLSNPEGPFNNSIRTETVAPLQWTDQEWDVLMRAWIFQL